MTFYPQFKTNLFRRWKTARWLQRRSRHSLLGSAFEPLEDRTLLTAGLPDSLPFPPPQPLLAPDTPPERIAEIEQALARFKEPEELPIGAFQFDDGDGWTSTAISGNGLAQGDPITLTWSIVPDGTSIGGFIGEPAAPSDFIAFMDGIYPGGSGSDLTQRPWFNLIEQVFDRWGQIGGQSYIYEPNDDGGTFAFANGLSGTRGDVRIGGHFIDGNSGVLAYNFFPNFGDMVFDTADSFYNNTGNNSRRLRNVTSHEHGHGLGITHSCPINQTKLMEPFFTSSFDGPQFDDILAANRGYGDALEPNDTTASAHSLGVLEDGSLTITDVSIDDDSDTDVYSFSITTNKVAGLVLTPIGSTYLSGPQNSNGSCSAGSDFNALEQSDLQVEILGSDGSTVLATANVTPSGQVEQLIDVPLNDAGDYFVRVTGADNAAQMYQLDVTISAANGSEFDYGDAPDPTYPTLAASNGAAHLIGGPLMLGGLVDMDADGQPNASAMGDDSDATDDEDGVVLPGTIAPGSIAPVTVTASVAGGLLNAWVDFNNDGDWTDSGEQIFADTALNAGPNGLSFPVPASATVTPQTFARFRISTQSGLGPVGQAPDGEVEDYSVSVEQLVAHLELENNTNDSIGSHDGLLAGDPVFINGRLGQGLQLDGNGDELAIPATALAEVSDDLTAALWIRPDSFGGFRSIFDSAGRELSLWINQAGSGWYGMGGINGSISFAEPFTLNEWQHVAFVKQGNEALLYRDGSLIATVVAADVDPREWVIGGNPSGGSRFVGAVDDVRLYSRALSSSEIGQLINQQALPTVTILAIDSAAEEEGQDPGQFLVRRGSSTTGDLTIRYTISGTASPGDYIESISGTVTIEDGNSTVAIPVTPVDDTDPEPSETLTLQLMSDALYAIGSPAAATVTISDNDAGTISSLVAHLELENNTDDSAGTHHGQLAGDPVFTVGQVGQGLELDGNGDQIEIPATALAEVVDAVTAALWIRPTAFGGFKAVFDTAGRELSLWINTPGSGWYGMGGVNGSINFSEPFTLNQWQHVAFVKDGNEARLYRDGTLVATVLASSIEAQDWIVGGNPSGGSRFIGGVDDIRLYNRALTATEIGQLANQQANLFSPLQAGEGGASFATLQRLLNAVNDRQTEVSLRGGDKPIQLSEVDGQLLDLIDSILSDSLSTTPILTEDHAGDDWFLDLKLDALRAIWEHVGAEIHSGLYRV